MILKSAASVVAPADRHHQQPPRRRHECAAQSVTTLATAATIGAGDAGEQRVPRRVPIVELNAHLTCTLCKGYFIDATTIIECLHSFCRACIVKYLESNKYCPVCDVQVHKTKPLLNIRPDKTLQDIVFKLVPRLYQNETQKRREFYAQHPECKPSALETRGEATYQHLLAPDEMLCISLLYDGASDKCPPRYLRCSVAVSVCHLQKLIRNKYDLSAYHRVEIIHQEDTLASYLTLMDIAYIYLWRRKGPLALTFRIYEHVRRATSGAALAAETNNNDAGGEEGWKEVQLRISENGEMSVTGIQDCLSLLDANILQDDAGAAGDDVDADANKEAGKPKDALSLKQAPSKKAKLERKTQQLGTAAASARDGKRETRSALQVKNATAIAVNAHDGVEKGKKPADAQQAHAEQPPNARSGRIHKDRKRKSMEVVADEKAKGTDKSAESGESKKSKPNELQAAPPSPPAAIGNSAKPAVSSAPSAGGVQGLSNNHPLRKHSLATTKPTSVVSTAAPTASTTNTVSVTPSVSLGLSSATTTSPSTPHAPAPPPSGVASQARSATGALPPEGQWAAKSGAATSNALRVTVASASSPARSTAAATSSTHTSAPQGKHHPQTHYGQYPTSRVYTPPPSNYTPINVPSVPSLQRMYMPPSAHQQRMKAMLEPPGRHWRPEARPQTPPPRAQTPPTAAAGAASEPGGVRPAKFFKKRNNTPRYLGCPASGVKPMYTVHDSPEKDDDAAAAATAAAAAAAKNKEQQSAKSGKESREKQQPPQDAEKARAEWKRAVSTAAAGVGAGGGSGGGATSSPTEKKSSSTEIKRHSIVKIDPKTLKPIAERAPDLTSLTTSNYHPSSTQASSAPQPSPAQPPHMQQDLKINTSSVSIFNPIKLQAERRSPHSPHASMGGGKRPATSPTAAHPGVAALTTNQAQGPGASQGQGVAQAQLQTAGLSSNQGQGQGGAAGAPAGNPTGVPPGMHAHQHPASHPGSKPKANLSFTPPNPFVPNLQAPTMSPSQFMYPSPAGFPYDPMMAAFLAYSHAPFNYDFHKMQMGAFGVQPLVSVPAGGAAGMMLPPSPNSPQQQQQPPGQASTPKKAKVDAKERRSSPKVDGPKVASSASPSTASPSALKAPEAATKPPAAPAASESASSSPSPTTTAAATASTLRDLKPLKDDAGKSNANCARSAKEGPAPGKSAPVSAKPAKSDKSLQNALDKLTKAKMNSEGSDHATSKMDDKPSSAAPAPAAVASKDPQASKPAKPKIEIRSNVRIPAPYHAANGTPPAASRTEASGGESQKLQNVAHAATKKCAAPESGKAVDGAKAKETVEIAASATSHSGQADKPPLAQASVRADDVVQKGGAATSAPHVAPSSAPGSEELRTGAQMVAHAAARTPESGAAPTSQRAANACKTEESPCEATNEREAGSPTTTTMDASQSTTDTAPMVPVEAQVHETIESTRCDEKTDDSPVAAAPALASPAATVAAVATPVGTPPPSAPADPAAASSETRAHVHREEAIKSDADDEHARPKPVQMQVQVQPVPGTRDAPAADAADQAEGASDAGTSATASK